MEYRIGDFSLVARLPVKTLRYYHEAGILEPSRIDPASGYRWYDDASLRRAKTVKWLRDLDFGIEEIAEIVGGGDSDEDILRAFRAKAEAIDEKIARYSAARGKIGAVLKEFSEDEAVGKGEIDVAMIGECLAASIRFSGRYGDVGPRFERLSSACGRWIAGPVFTLYNDAEYKEIDADMEACIELRPEAASRFSPPEGIRVASLPAFRALAATHEGPYETIGESYRRIFSAAKERGLELSTPYREVYLKGPGLLIPRNPRKFLTRILLPLASTRN